MRRYYFNLYNDADVIDDDGMEYHDLQQARIEAIRGARALIAEHIVAGRPVTREHRIEIADDRGIVLATVFFGDVFTVIG
jgi:hypothetical protein